MNACIHAYMKTGETEGMERSGERTCFLNEGEGDGTLCVWRVLVQGWVCL